MKNFYRQLRNWFKQLITKGSIRALRSLHVKLVLSYAPELSRDGLGAQLQRILSIHHLARSLKSGYLHSGIEQATWHALDNFGNSKEYAKYLEQIRETFHIESSITGDFNRTLTINKLTLTTLLFYGLKSIYFREQYLLRIAEPFSVSDFLTPLYAFIPSFPKFEKIKARSRGSNFEHVLAIHYRNASGRFDLYHGQQISRQLPLNFFSDAINRIKHSLKVFPDVIEVITDAPKSVYRFKFPSDETFLWENSPEFSSDHLLINGISDESFLRALPSDVSVSIIRGGNPLISLAKMSSADTLIMSRSSLSYVAALLSSGNIIYPKGFWHPPKSTWYLH